jgi:hypothetical protein
MDWLLLVAHAWFDLLRRHPISTRVNKPENDDPSVVKPVVLANSAA